MANVLQIFKKEETSAPGEGLLERSIYSDVIHNFTPGEKQVSISSLLGLPPVDDSITSEVTHEF